MAPAELKIRLDFGYYPEKYTCEGEGISPRVRIEGAGEGFLALIIEDHDAPERPYVHWVAWDIPAREEISEGVDRVERPEGLDGGMQGRTTSGAIGYEGPCPPKGETHKYELKMFGYDRPLDLKVRANRVQLLEALEGKGTRYGEAAAHYGR